LAFDHIDWWLADAFLDKDAKSKCHTTAILALLGMIITGQVGVSYSV
jgi:hypothetical protein